MRHAAGPRRELDVRTVFNLLGPLTNPAGARNQVIGVSDAARQRRLAEVASALGADHVLLVNADGLDELSIAGPSSVVELRAGRIDEYEISPMDFSIEERSLEGLQARSPAESLSLVVTALTQPESAASDVVALNAGAAIYAAGVSTTLANGVLMAQDAIAAGLAKERFDELVRVTKLMSGA
jgi:anthranilate phosphoribosyltransferase